ncbi:MAG: metallophosphoesterase family protein [Thermoplasmatota archaeon]
MKTLLISDIHGNYEALQTVLDVERWDKILCMGDLVDYGPSPEDVVQTIKEKVDHVVRGNHDNAVAFGVDCGCGYEMKALSEETRKYTMKVISDGSRSYLSELPISEEVGNRFITHGAPSDMYRYLKPETPEDEFEVFDDVDSETILLGHTHIPMDRRVKNKRYINPGSLGQPRDGDWRASYAFLEDGELYFERMEYEVGKVIERMEKVGLPERAQRILKEGEVVG